MPFRVRQWPVSPDPRSSIFTFVGWNWGQVVSWRWVMSSTEATGIYSFLNDGIVLDQNGFDDTNALWQRQGDLVDPSVYTLAKGGFDPPIGGTPHTIELRVNIAPELPVNPSIGGLDFLYPNAIRVFGPFDMTILGVPNADIPNGVTLTPVIWDFELT